MIFVCVFAFGILVLLGFGNVGPFGGILAVAVLAGLGWLVYAVHGSGSLIFYLCFVSTVMAAMLAGIAARPRNSAP